MKWDAEKYDAVKAPQIEAGKELMSLAGIRENDAILDLGCGTGKLTKELAHLASKGVVVGIDPSEEMLEKARVAASHTGNMTVLRAAAEEINFLDKFDLAFSNSSMQWVKDQPKAAATAYRALKQGGRIAFQFPAANFCAEFFDSVDGAISMLGYDRFFEGWQSPWRFPSKEEYESMLNRAGFRALNVFYKKYRVGFGTIPDVMIWWSSAGLRPYLAALPEGAQEHFKEAFAEGFKRNKTDAGIEFDFRRLFALAKKEI